MVQRNLMIEKTNLKRQNILHERNNKHKVKNRNFWKEQPKIKLDGKETSNNQLNIEQDHCSTSNFEFYIILFEKLDAISNNNFDKDLINSVITNSWTTDQ